MTAFVMMPVMRYGFVGMPSGDGGWRIALLPCLPFH
jgi:hypothetical protein